MAHSAHARAAALPAPRVPVREAPGRQAPGRAEGRRAAAPVARRRAALNLPLPLLAFVACLAVLAVGRVTLSFAVVQKNLQTDSVVSQYRQLAVENTKLKEQAVGMSSALALRAIAIRRYHLVQANQVEYVTVPPAAARKVGAPRP